MTATPQATDSARLAASLSAYLGSKFDADVTIGELRRLAGGASHETWAFDADVAGAAPSTLPLILRRAFADTLIDGGMAVEFALLEELHRLGIPVPRPRFCAPTGDGIDTPFMIIERAPGTDLRKALANHAGALDRTALGHALVRQQAAIHALPWRTRLAEVAPPTDPTSGGLERWTAPIDRRPDVTSPLLAAAIDWLRANVPPACDRCFVHGDFKTNNIVLDDAGGAVVLDWELAHIGDPIEDVAWTMLWCTRDDLVGGLLSHEEYLKAYAQASNVVVETERLFYWQMFALVKLASIFIAGITPVTARPPRPMLCMLGRALPWIDTELAPLLIATIEPRAVA